MAHSARLNHFSKEGEQTVLGAILQAAESCLPVSQALGISEKSFHIEKHKLIFKAISLLDDESCSVDVITVAEKIRDMGKLKSDTLDYITQLAISVPSVANIEAYCKVLMDYERRRLYFDVLKMSQLVLRTGLDPLTEERLDDPYLYIDRLLDGLQDGSVGKAFVTLDEALKEAIDVLDKKANGEHDKGLETGYEVVDERLQGVNGLWVVAARPGMGKTAYVLNILLNVAKEEKSKPYDERKCIVSFNLEMSNVSIVNRLLSAQGRIDNSLLKDASIFDDDNGDEHLKLEAAAYALKGMPVFLNDSSRINVFEIAALVRQLLRKQKIGLIIIDYLGLLSNVSSASTRSEQVGEITRTLKILSSETKCPILLVCQLNRDVEGRKDKRPIMSDIRDSGAVEQDADLIQFLYRDEYYYENSDAVGLVEVITKKFREGNPGTDVMRFQGKYSLFSELISQPSDNDEVPEYDFR